MFATFKMALPDMNETIWKQYYEKGLAVYSTHKQKIKESLDKYLSVDYPPGARPLVLNCERKMNKI